MKRSVGPVCSELLMAWPAGVVGIVERGIETERPELPGILAPVVLIGEPPIGRDAGDDVIVEIAVVRDGGALQGRAIDADFAIDRLVDKGIGGKAGDGLRHRAFDLGAAAGPASRAR